MALSLPIRPGVPHQEFQLAMDGVLYGVELRWNSRAAVWVLVLKDTAGTVLLAGVRVCLGGLLLPPRRARALPPGELLLLPATSGASEPTLETLGDGVRLVYLDATDVAEALA